MIFARLASAVTVVCLIGTLLLAAAGPARRFLAGGPDWLLPALCVAAGALAYAGWLLLYPRLRDGYDRLVSESAAPLQEWTRKARPAEIYAGIVVLSAATLFLELVLIRWQASLFPVFALYKNFTLLACFCGLGIGYAMSRRAPLLVAAALPLLGLTLMFLTALRHAEIPEAQLLLFFVPVQEEASVFAYRLKEADNWLLFNAPVYLLLSLTFLFNVMVMLPVAQFCGYLMNRMDSLAGYGCNLLGSIGGVMLLFLASLLWTGPVIWFTVAAALVLWHQLPSPLARNIGVAAAFFSVLAAAWPAEPLVHNIYSPYQRIQKVAKEDGLMEILSNGSYYQKVYDLSAGNRNRARPEMKEIIGYYELPFKTAPGLDKVVIVGAGSGNDVAAALRHGAKSVDAVEIDPAIIGLGRANHPERPYQDERVNVINDDARTFFRNAPGNGSYDAIIYGVLDSHILLSHGSNVRLDSFVYTQEGLREAFGHLKPGGLMSVSFALPNLRMGHKIYRMLSDMPEAGKPVAVHTLYDNANTYTFLLRKGAGVKLPAGFLAAHGLEDQTKKYAAGGTETLDLPTDDWPFFYMEGKMWPSTYVLSLFLVMALAAVMVRGFLPEQRWDRTMLPFFFLGAGFMLVETKAITELGLVFGNTWQVIGITIIGVLTMAFIANLVVARSDIRKIGLSAALLLVTVAAGYAVAISGGLPHTGFAGKLAAVAMLTSPMLFSGIVFSTLLKRTKDLPSALAYNILGAMLGGLLEYNSMQFGFAFLYVLAFVIYSLAWATAGMKKRA